MCPSYHTGVLNSHPLYPLDLGDIYRYKVIHTPHKAMYMKRHWSSSGILALILTAMCLFCVSPAEAVEVSIDGGAVAPGESFAATLTVDTVKELAGIKIVIDYNHHLLIYAGGAKTNHTGAMMHVVNDKKPGRLILVMASAQGISGDKIPLFTFTFTARKDLEKKQETSLNIAELQMMSEKLKNIDASQRTGSIVIMPKGAPSP